MKAVIIWRNSRRNCDIDSYKSWKKNLSLRKQSVCWFSVNNHVIFNVLCKYCQSLIFFFLLITIFCTLWKKINLKNKTMNCFLFYFQQPIKSQPSIKCHINAKYHSSGQQSIPNLTDGITVNRRGQSIFGDDQVYIKLTVNKINNKIHIFTQNKAKFMY